MQRQALTTRIFLHSISQPMQMYGKRDLAPEDGFTLLICAGRTRSSANFTFIFMDANKTTRSLARSTSLRLALGSGRSQIIWSSCFLKLRWALVILMTVGTSAGCSARTLTLNLDCKCQRFNRWLRTTPALSKA